ncbi:class II aldolase/adducin family protein [Streptomyces marispadix]|uniref:Class II aldolase/adducin family protein n=1 Tax=Streptomyces marispadix TaxID=2922868 RepID=A0ABS9T5L8_9ACTN|nr:class II aldolase/adducin family protein [Streptomyces marispadix]MCH6163846.1 class II aldolase/adducin family protein [Streptomyces marispadix]
MTDEVDQLVEGYHALGNAGHGDLVWGHVALRDASTGGFWMKAAGWGFDEVTRDRLVLLSSDGSMLAGTGPRHVEWPIHAEILRVRPEVSAVVHTHAGAAVVFASLATPLRAISHDGVPFAAPDVPRFTETADLIRSAELGAALAATLGDANGVLIPGHGLVTAAATLAEAAMYAVLLDRACAHQLRALQAGGPRLWSDASEVAAKQSMWTPASLASGFDYLVRRAHESRR